MLTVNLMQTKTKNDKVQSNWIHTSLLLLSWRFVGDQDGVFYNRTQIFTSLAPTFHALRDSPNSSCSWPYRGRSSHRSLPVFSLHTCGRPKPIETFPKVHKTYTDINNILWYLLVRYSLNFIHRHCYSTYPLFKKRVHARSPSNDLSACSLIRLAA